MNRGRIELTMGDQLVDAVGVEHGPARPSARIVSLVPSITELLFDLGLESQIVGRTTFCVHPTGRVDKVKRVGGTKKVKLDTLRGLYPTHVIVNIDENTRALVDEIAHFVPHIIVTHPIEPRDNLNLFRLLGGIFDRAQTARRLCRDFELAYNILVDSARHLPTRRVLYLIWKSPWMTVSKPTYISRMLSLVHWETVAHVPETRYPEVTFSDDLFATTDIMLFSSEPYPFKQKHVEAFRHMFPAVNRTLSLIDGEMISWYGSRAIPGLKYLSAFAPALLETKPQ